MAEFCFSLRFATYNELHDFHENFAKFLQWQAQRAASRADDRRGKHVAKIHERARQMRERDPSQPYRILFRLAACQIGAEDDCDTDDATVNNTIM